ncbi:unnamed protein product [Adineta steineri]|uniref:Tryptophan 2,3-dioxygenase n=1 Tax=Adineta steineri TaxID=433720 RepID=A0A819J903_9BILA|nr:unnamed protein product [Adineta steineri]CAF3929918.1 unnamed protein product [Adineta steineri]
MSCPYLQSDLDNMENNNSNVDEIPILTKTANSITNDHVHVTEPLNYTTYLGLDSLLSSLRCLSHVDRSNENSLPVHDEHFFIIIHQAFELWFKEIIYEIDSIRDIFGNNDDVATFVLDINLRLNRIGKVWKILIDQLQLLESMTPMEFVEFRDFVTPVSGFQSLQFRIIEMKLGLTDKSRDAYKSKYFTETMFKGKQSNELQTSIGEVSLLRYIERWLEKIYVETSFNFCKVYEKAVESMIDHDKQEKIQNGIDEQIAEKEADKAKLQFDEMINEEKYNALVNSNQRRISHKAMLAALMIAHYYQQPCLQQIYQIISLLMDNDTLMTSWRHRHILLVLRQIGRKPGTGGTNGFTYLRATLTFLPEFVGDSVLPRATLSSLTLQSPRQIPIMIKQQPRISKHSSNQDSTQYKQFLFCLLLFVAGYFFSSIY